MLRKRQTLCRALFVAETRLLLGQMPRCDHFMIRDRRMQMLITKKIRAVTRDSLLGHCQALLCTGVTILVMGGSGDYFDVAGTVQWRISSAGKPQGRGDKPLYTGASSEAASILVFAARFVAPDSATPGAGQYLRGGRSGIQMPSSPARMTLTYRLLEQVRETGQLRRTSTQAWSGMPL